MPTPFLARLVTSALAALILPAPSFAQAPMRPHPIALRDVRLVDAPDAPRVTIVMRAGRIEAVRALDEPLPGGTRAIEGAGMLALPAFIDAYTFAGCKNPEPKPERDLAPDQRAEVLVDMREANRKGIAPAFKAADAFALEKDEQRAYREHGFGALLSAPHEQLLPGASALASLREAAARDAFVAPIVFDHASFQCSGPGYPSTLMGSIAQLRQFLLDAQRHALLVERRASGKLGPRPPYDADLAAVRALLAKERRVACAAESAADIERWIALADELGFEIAISGGREAWKRADLLRTRSIPVFLTLDWGEEVEDPREADKKQDSKRDDERWIYRAPLGVREAKRQEWIDGRDCARVLFEAGVPFAFGSGKRTPRELLAHVRQLVEAGLPLAAAQAALTSDAARLLGVQASLGSIEPGRDATIAVWDKHPLREKNAHVAWLFVDGESFHFDIEHDELVGAPDPGVDASGTWTFEITLPGAEPAQAELEMKPDGSVTGTLHFKPPGEGAEVEAKLEGQVAGKKMRLSATPEAPAGIGTIVLEGELQGDTFAGEAKLGAGAEQASHKLTGTRKPKDGAR